MRDHHDINFHNFHSYQYEIFFFFFLGNIDICMVLHKMYVGIQPRNVITCGSHIDHASLNEDVEILNEVRIHIVLWITIGRFYIMFSIAFYRARDVNFNFIVAVN